MPFNPNVVPPRLIEAAQKQNLIPLIGAGISRQAGAGFPNWNELLLQMKERAVVRGYINQTEAQEIEQMISRGKSLMAAEGLRYSLPSDEYQTILEEQFNPPNVQPAEIHKALFRLRPPLILTTNYDRLLEDGYAQEFQRVPQVVTRMDAVIIQKYLQSGRFTHDRPVIFKIHGTIDQPESLVLSERDYRELIYRQPGYWLVLSAIFLTQVILMLGFSFADLELRLLLEELRESLKHLSHPDYIYLPGVSVGSVETRRLREDFGVEVIPYDATPGHPEVLEFISFLIAQKHQAA